MFLFSASSKEILITYMSSGLEFFFVLGRCKLCAAEPSVQRVARRAWRVDDFQRRHSEWLCQRLQRLSRGCEHSFLSIISSWFQAFLQHFFVRTVECNGALLAIMNFILHVISACLADSILDRNLNDQGAFIDT